MKYSPSNGILMWARKKRRQKMQSKKKKPIQKETLQNLMQSAVDKANALDVDEPLLVMPEWPDWGPESKDTKDGRK